MGLKFSSLLFSGVSQLFNKVKIFFQEWEGKILTAPTSPPDLELLPREPYPWAACLSGSQNTNLDPQHQPTYHLWRGRECAIRGSVATERDPSEIRRASICLDTATTCKGKLELATCIQCVRSIRLSVDRKGTRTAQAFWLPSWVTTFHQSSQQRRQGPGPQAAADPPKRAQKHSI